MAFIYLNKDSRDVLHHLEQKASCTIHSQDTQATAELIWTTIEYALVQGKSISLDLKNAELQRFVENKINANKLSTFIARSSSPYLQDETVAKINVLAKKTNDGDQLFDKARIDFENLHQLAYAYSEIDNRVIFGQKTLKQIREISESRDQDHKGLRLDHPTPSFLFNQDEYWYLKTTIEEASKQWSSIYKLIIGQFIFSPKLEGNSRHLIPLLSKRKADLENAIDQLQEIRDSYKKQLINQYNTAYIEAISILNLLKKGATLQSFETIEKKSLFFNRKKQGSQPNALTQSILQNKIFDQIENIEEHTDLIPMLEVAISGWKEKRNGEIINKDKRLNRLNVDTEIYSLTFQKIENILKACNEDQLLNYQFELTAHSLLGQVDYLNQVQNILERALWVCKNADGFIQWQSFLNSKTSDEQTLISALSKIDEEHWLSCFEHWYLKQLINHHHSPYLEIDKNELKQLPANYTSLRSEQIENWIVKQNQDIQNGIKGLKKTSREDYQRLLGKKTNGKVVIDACNELINSICPIYIGSNTNADLTISDKALSIQGKEYFLFIDDDALTNPDYHLNACISGNQLLSEYPISKKLMIVKSLANSLRFYSLQNRIFILKKKIVITCLSDIMNRKHLDLLKDQIVKEISLGSEPVERITEYLLINDLPCEIWIEDFIVNTGMKDFILPQIKLLEAFVSAGFTVKSKEDLKQTENVLLQDSENNKALIKEAIPTD